MVGGVRGTFRPKSETIAWARCRKSPPAAVWSPSPDVSLRSSLLGSSESAYAVAMTDVSRRDVFRFGAALGTLSFLDISGVVWAAPGVEEIRTTCNMCYLGCSVIAEKRDGGVVRLRGDPDSPVNRGKLCAKGNAGLHKAVHRERLGHPLVRAGARGAGHWKQIGWDALPTILSGSITNLVPPAQPEIYCG